MGDLFHDSSSQQTAINQQLGVQGGGANSSTIAVGANATANFVDPGAIRLAQDTLHEQSSVVHDVLGSNAAIALGAIAAGQNTANASTAAIQQTAHEAFDLVHSASTDAISAAVSASPSAQVGEIAAGAVSTQKLLIIGGALVAVVVVWALLRRK